MPTAPRDPPDPAIRAVVDGVRRLDRGLRLAARRVEGRGISAAQLFVLEQLQIEEPLSVNELAARTFTDRSSVSGVLDRLVAGGLVTRRNAPTDRRRAEITMTASGRRLLRQAPPPPTHLLVNALRRLPPRSVRALGDTLHQLNEELGFRAAEMLFEE